MKYLALAAILSLANASVVTKRASALDVKLEMAGNTAVKAVITNTGAEAIKIWKTGSLFGQHATEKVQVFQGSKFDLIVRKEWLCLRDKAPRFLSMELG